jgi:hypothetical protein
MSKLKKGDKVRFPFAGTTHVGEFLEVKNIEYGSVKRTYGSCKTEDGTVYPVDLTLINKI